MVMVIWLCQQSLNHFKIWSVYISYEYEQNLSAKTVDTCIITIQTEI